MSQLDGAHYRSRRHTPFYRKSSIHRYTGDVNRNRLGAHNPGRARTTLAVRAQPWLHLAACVALAALWTWSLLRGLSSLRPRLGRCCVPEGHPEGKPGAASCSRGVEGLRFTPIPPPFPPAPNPTLNTTPVFCTGSPFRSSGQTNSHSHSPPRSFLRPQHIQPSPLLLLPF